MLVAMAKAESQYDDLISLSEKNFVINSIADSTRIDGRGLYDVRTLRISFGSTWGRVQVQLGATKYVYILQAWFLTSYHSICLRIGLLKMEKRHFWSTWILILFLEL